MKLSRFLSKLAFSLQRSRQNSKKEAWNARGVETRFYVKSPRREAKNSTQNLEGKQKKTNFRTPRVREAEFESVVVVVSNRRSDQPEFGSKR